MSREAQQAPNKVKLIWAGLDFTAGLPATQTLRPDWTYLAVASSGIRDAIERERPDVVVPLMTRMDASLIAHAAAHGVRLIHQFGAGLEGVDVEAANAAGVPVANIPAAGAGTGNAVATAEHAVYLLLGLLRQAVAIEGKVGERRLGGPVGNTLQGKTVLLVGFGAIGHALTPILRAFGARVTAFRHAHDRAWARQDEALVDAHGSFHPEPGGIGGSERLIEMAAEAEVMIVCCPLTDETRGLVDSKVLSALVGPPREGGGWLVNVARGAVVDRAALFSSVEQRELRGVAVDVFWREPFEGSLDDESGLQALLDLRAAGHNVVVTPHVAGTTEESIETMARVFAASVETHL